MTKKGIILLISTLIVCGCMSFLGFSVLQKLHQNTQRATCITQLKILSSNAEKLMFQNPNHSLPSMEDLAQTFPNQQLPQCPKGGTYSLEITHKPIARCSYGEGHSL